MSIKDSPIAVLGAGSWGTALAIHLSRNNNVVNLWGNITSELEDMKKERCNKHYLPDIPFPEKLNVHTDLDQALKDVKDILLVVPSHAFHDVIKNLAPKLSDQNRIAWATKGIDQESGKLLHEHAKEFLDEKIPLAVISGPSFAKEVAENLPTAVTIASSSKEFCNDLMNRFISDTFGVYKSDDIIGVQLGGAVKNIIAVAAGISDGLGYGANARAALITQGLSEMIRLGEALGAKRETFIGLAGLGDLILTCTDNQSRNRRFGLAIGRGDSIESAEKEIGQVVEGIITADTIYQLAQKKKLKMPITEAVYMIMKGKMPASEIVNGFLSQDLP